MALYGVLGDIHGNREALEAALAALGARRARIVCLGNIVGHNADPDECVELVRQYCVAAVAGPHDLIALGRRGFEGCSNDAEYALRRTRRELSGESRAWLAALPSSAALEEGITLLPGEIHVIGRSAQPKVHEIGPGEKLSLRREDSYLVRPGPVDASRKRSDRLAQCALLDSAACTVEFLSVAYDGAASEAKAAVFGYRINPLTDRLYSLRRRISAKF